MDVVRHAVDSTEYDFVGGRWQEPVSGKQLFPRVITCAYGFHGQNEAAVQATGLGYPLASAFARWTFAGFRRHSIELQRVDDCILSSPLKAIPERTPPPESPFIGRPRLSTPSSDTVPKRTT